MSSLRSPWLEAWTWTRALALGFPAVSLPVCLSAGLCMVSSWAVVVNAFVRLLNTQPWKG